MTETELLTLIRGGENIRVEFKKSTNDVTKDVYDISVRIAAIL